MLTGRRWRAAALVAATATVMALVATGSASGALGRVVGRAPAAVIPANQPAVSVKATKPVVPDPPWASQLPPDAVYPIWTDQSHCYFQGVQIDCKGPAGTGFFNPLDNCYWLAKDPQPKPGAAVWLGLSVAVGNIYDVRCVVGLNATLKPLLASVKVLFASKTPPGTTSDVPGAAIALGASLSLAGILPPAMGVAPDSASSRQAAIDADRDHSTAGLVGLPTWYWSTSNLLTVGPVTLKVALPILSLQANLLGQRLEWDTGDGGNIVVCDKTGQAFTTDRAGTTPACGYTYTKPGTYAVGARSIWFLGVNLPLVAVGTVLVVRSSLPRYIKIDELQVVTE